MTIDTDVFVRINGLDLIAGRMHTHRRQGVESATFVYAESFLAHEDAYPLDPSMPLYSGAHQTRDGLKLFGAFSDSAPDRWGRNLIARDERIRAASSGTQQQSLGEIDLLLGVRDDLRQGAIRFQSPDSSEFLASETDGIPAMNDLAELLAISERLESDVEIQADLRRLLRAGSSLGGARPKTHVRSRDGRIAIAKFPATSVDTWNVMAWEKVALTLAENAGITVASSELVDIAGRDVLIVYRFDRTPMGERIGYQSAMTMLEAADGESRSYLDIAEAIEERSPVATEDLQELWRRIALSILISNTDDHLRNHAFLHASKDSWRLSPAFDLNPNPEPGVKELSTSIDETVFEARIDVLMEVAPLFRFSVEEARTMAAQVSTAVSEWRTIASRVGLKSSEISAMAPAFEHDAANQARFLV